MTAHIESLFESFRTQGDVGALGEVFDRTADELFRLGVHLTRDPDRAEDLLQQTFVAAIEKRRAFRAGQPLLPWLTGILYNMARRSWRDATRRPDPARLSWKDAVDAPSGLGEVQSEVLRAMDRLRPPYREVVILHLRYAMKATEIALVTGRAPGTVRTQLQRGLGQLRERLPVGVRGALALPRGRDALRDQVLAEASAGVLPVAAGLSKATLFQGLARRSVALLTAAFIALFALGLPYGSSREKKKESAGPPPQERAHAPRDGTAMHAAAAQADTRGGEASASAPPTRRRLTVPPAGPPADWTLWWRRNAAIFENLKYALYHHMSSENPLFQSDAGGKGQRGAETRWTRKRVVEVILPALREALDEEKAYPAHVRAAAWIALGRVARTRDQLVAIREGLTGPPPPDVVVTEATALAPGLLHRANTENRFAARDLDDLRGRLFHMVEDVQASPRARGFAAVAIGLLGGQPTGPRDGEVNEEAARATTVRLFEALERSSGEADLATGLLIAIGLRPPTTVTPAQECILTTCALDGDLGGIAQPPSTRSFAIEALGRLGGRACTDTLTSLLAAERPGGADLAPSATVALGRLGCSLEGQDRTRVAKLLTKVCAESADARVAGLGLIALARILAQEVGRRSTSVLDETSAEELLLERAATGPNDRRSFAALALALVLREIPDDLGVAEYQEFRRKALTTLREGIGSKRMDKQTRAAFCTAIGIARDSRSREALREIVATRNGDKMLRGYAALGLGLIGEATSGITATIVGAMQERSSKELRRQATVALGLFGNPKIGGMNKDAVEVLLEELKGAETHAHGRQVCRALSSLGDHRAIALLAALVRDDSAPLIVRTEACAGLGRIGDLEYIPTLARPTVDTNPFLSGGVMEALVEIR